MFLFKKSAISDKVRCLRKEPSAEWSIEVLLLKMGKPSGGGKGGRPSNFMKTHFLMEIAAFYKKIAPYKKKTHTWPTYKKTQSLILPFIKKTNFSNK